MYQLPQGTTLNRKTVPPPGHTTTVIGFTQSTSRKERHHHMGMDYWFMTPVSYPDNTTQELPLSLAVKDERSNCRSKPQ
ncbi:hypothetical protein Taro_023520 [Colocasia esculenta]|uniref:Uncharacterized protein n=1 Tax=Colocasia esculenta TaxID=4460 RepID=A0A843V4E2_COLES|nr:hypothetical protein [Colocasia esculenta]